MISTGSCLKCLSFKRSRLGNDIKDDTSKSHQQFICMVPVLLSNILHLFQQNDCERDVCVVKARV